MTDNPHNSVVTNVPQAVAAEWTAITERVGTDKVRAAYRNVVALEDNS